jgi:hypothetical protein
MNSHIHGVELGSSTRAGALPFLRGMAGPVREKLSEMIRLLTEQAIRKKKAT